jgi:hypothetical protein
MGTELPVELWEKIVGNLPPPPPKLVPLIILTGSVAVHQNQRDNYRVCVSKAVSIEERCLLGCEEFPRYIRVLSQAELRTNYFEWKDNGIHWTKEIPCWAMLTSVCTRALFLGFTFLTKEDRARTEQYPSGLNPNMRICMVKN